MITVEHILSHEGRGKRGNLAGSSYKGIRGHLCSSRLLGVSLVE